MDVPDDADAASYRRGYAAALEAVREAAAGLELQALAESGDGLNQQDGGDDADLLVNDDDEGPPAAECPECGAELSAELGGRRCLACGFRDGEAMPDDDVDLSDLR